MYVGLQSAVSFIVRSPITSVAASAKATLAVAFGDLDKDGDADLVIGNFGSDNLLLRNDGAGGFSVTTLPGGLNANTTAIGLGDVNNDGFLDIIVGNYNEDNEVLISSGGNFTSNMTIVGGKLARDTSYKRTTAVSLGDLDGDRDADLVIGNFNGDNLLLSYNEDGSFSVGVLPGGNTNTTAVGLGDVNNDGFLDIIVGNCKQANELLINDGSGKFIATPITSLSNASLPPSQPTTTFDFSSATSPGWSTGGGIADVTPFAFTKTNGSTLFQALYPTGPTLGVNGSGSYFYAEASSPRVLGDLFTLAYNGSVCSNMGQRVSTVAFYYHMYGAGVGELRLINAAGATLWSLSGNQGYAWHAVSIENVSVAFAFEYRRGVSYLGDAAVAHVTVSCGAAPSPPPPPACTTAVAIGDVDGDGNLDLVIGNGGGTGQTNELLLGDGSGGFNSSATFPGGVADTHALAFGDVDGDGDPNPYIAPP